MCSCRVPSITACRAASISGALEGIEDSLDALASNEGSGRLLEVKYSNTRTVLSAIDRARSATLGDAMTDRSRKRRVMQ